MFNTSHNISYNDDCFTTVEKTDTTASLPIKIHYSHPYTARTSRRMRSHQPNDLKKFQHTPPSNIMYLQVRRSMQRLVCTTQKVAPHKPHQSHEKNTSPQSYIDKATKTSDTSRFKSPLSNYTKRSNRINSFLIDQQASFCLHQVEKYYLP